MSRGWCCDSFQLPNSSCVCVVSLRKEAEDEEEAEEAAPAPCSVCADGGCRRFSKVQGHPAPSRQASQRQETAARDPRSKTHICGLMLLLMESLVKFRGPQNIFGASKQKNGLRHCPKRLRSRWGLVLKRKRKKKSTERKQKMAPYSLFDTIQDSRSPEIPNCFEKTIWDCWHCCVPTSTW